MQNLAEILKKSFDKHFNAPIEVWEEFAKFCELVTFKKDQIIKQQGTTEQYFHFIIKGCAGIFLWKENNFVCLDFAFEYNTCSDYMSFLTKTPTDLEIVALENSEMIRMTSANFTNLGNTPVGQIIMLKTTEASFLEKQQQQMELLTKTAEERYQILQIKYPNIHQRVAQKYIASYLGITPESFSRIRKKIS